jgi:hypothetical protein
LDESARRFIYDPQLTYVSTPRQKDDVAALILARLCIKEDEEKSACTGEAREQKIGYLEEAEWHWRADYPEYTDYQEREAKRQRKSPRSVLWTAVKRAAGTWWVGRLFGVFWRGREGGGKDLLVVW